MGGAVLHSKSAFETSRPLRLRVGVRIEEAALEKLLSIGFAWGEPEQLAGIVANDRELQFRQGQVDLRAQRGTWELEPLAGPSPLLADGAEREFTFTLSQGRLGIRLGERLLFNRAARALGKGPVRVFAGLMGKGDARARVVLTRLVLERLEP
jgi:hypothetical protein